MNRVTSHDGTSIAFDRSGSGPPLVVVGGALSDRSAAASLAEALAPRFTVFTYDRRGRGDSGDTLPYAVEREVEDLRAVVDEAGGSAFVHGHSSGAALALEAVARGLAVPRLALYEPPFIVDDSRPPLPDGYVEHLVELVAADRRGDAVEYFLTTGPGMPTEAIAAMREAPSWPAMEAVAHTLVYDGRIMGDAVFGTPLPSDRWATATMPTLVMDGGASPDWVGTSMQALADVLPNAERRTLPGQDHAPAPEVRAPVLVEFFAG